MSDRETNEPTAVLTGCPGPADPEAVLARIMGEPDDEDESDLGPGDWWDVGYAEGLYAGRKRPPADEENERLYADGYAMGMLERAAEKANREAADQREAERKRFNDERAAWNLPPAGPDDPIPF